MSQHVRFQLCKNNTSKTNQTFFFFPFLQCETIASIFLLKTLSSCDIKKTILRREIEAVLKIFQFLIKKRSYKKRGRKRNFQKLDELGLIIRSISTETSGEEGATRQSKVEEPRIIVSGRERVTFVSSIDDDEIITVEFVCRLFWRPAARCLANLSAPSPGTAERNLYASAAQWPKPDNHRFSPETSPLFVAVSGKCPVEDREPCSLCKWRTVNSRMSAFSSLLMSSPSVYDQ